MAKVKFTRENIVNATYDLMKQEGMKNISARKIAKKLKGSTAPIYAHFSNLEILKEEVIEIAKSNFSKYISKEYTDRQMLNVAMGIAIFAREERELFKSIFLMGDDFKDLFDIVVKDVVDKSKHDERFEGLSEEKIEKIKVRVLNDFVMSEKEYRVGETLELEKDLFIMASANGLVEKE